MIPPNGEDKVCIQGDAPLRGILATRSSAVPANLTPEYFNAEKAYKAAQTEDEKLACLQHMLAVIPKHKGTEKLQADLKRRIAMLKDRLEHHAKKKGVSHRVKPEGAGQIVLIGPPNSGKSSLLAALTHAEPEIGDYPFTTREPLPGMAAYKDIQIQLVDLPPISREHCESFVFDNIRGAHGALLVIDPGSTDPVDDYQMTVEILQEKKILLIPPDEEIPDVNEGGVAVRALLLFSKSDLDPEGELTALTRELIDTNLPVHPVSIHSRAALDGLTATLFGMLRIIRVYTKQPGKPPDLVAPFTAPIGATVLDLAGIIHKDFAEGLKSARVWGSAKFDGQVVQRDHVLRDGDIVELTM